MIAFDCFVQEGCVEQSERPSLEAGIEAACSEVLGRDQGPLQFSWTVIPSGFGFRGGRPSTTSLVRGRIPDGCDPARRAQLLASIADSWCDTVGAPPTDVIVSIRDWSWSG